jgi:hypothetical protein
MRLNVRCAILFVLNLILLAQTCYAADFSADMVSTERGRSTSGKFYVSGDKSRVEMAEGIIISRMDKKIVWMLMPQQKMYIEQPLDLRSAAVTQEKVDGEIERKVVGKEKVNGRDTTKYLVTFESQKKRESVFQWIDEAAHIPVKTAAVDQSWSSEFKNIQAASQNKDLFEIPAGYQSMSMGMPNMKDIMGSMKN